MPDNDEPRRVAVPPMRVMGLPPDTTGIQIAHERLREIGRENNRRAMVMADASEYQLRAAELTCAAVMTQIGEFEASLTEHEEAFLCVVGGPAGLLMLPQAIEYISPDKLIFRGQDQSGHRVMAVQHVTQLNLMLQAVPIAPGEEPRRMGFHGPQD